MQASVRVRPSRLLFLGYKVVRSLRLWGFKVTNPDGLSFIRLRSSATQSHLFAYAHQLRSLIYSLMLSSYVVSFFRMAIYSLTLISFAVSFLLFPFSFLLACLLKVDKIALSAFLTSVNIAQKVKKFKTLTSVKKNLGSLTKKFGK